MNPAAKACIVLHYSEIGVKGGNRKFFENQLAKNIRAILGDLLPARVQRVFGRFVIPLAGDFDWPAISARLQKVVGLANFALAEMVEQDAERIVETACRQMQGQKFSTFRVTTRRIQKSFPLTSDALSAKAGEAIRRQSGATVDLDHPEAVCFIEIVDNFALVYREKLPGLRGLPVGGSGKAVSLLSAGIDSPVASYKIITRGVKLIFVHFHSIPYTSPASVSNAKRLMERLAQYQLSAKLYCVPFLEIQQAILLSAPVEYRVVLYRRAMLRIAEKIAKKEKAQALVTGESIGQVASQTLANLRVINEAAALPVLRPLSGSSKEEIIALARQIGTFEISTEPYEDCCSLFVPAHPATAALPGMVVEAESKLDWKTLIAKALKGAEVGWFGFRE